MVRYFGPDNGSAYVILPNGKPAVGRLASVWADEAGTIVADILDGDRDTQGAPVLDTMVDATGRLNFWFPDEQPVVWVSVNDGPLVRVTADLQDQLEDIVLTGGGGDVTTADLTAAIAAHSADTTAVHGITDTSALETTAGAQSKANAAQAAAIAIAAADATTKAATAQANAATDATNKVAAHVAAADPHGDRAYADGQLVGKQPLDSDLTAIAALAPADDSLMQRKASAWVGRTPAQVKTDLALVKGDVGLGNVDNTADAAKTFTEAQVTNLVTDLAAKQPLDPDLTTLAGLAATTDNFIVAVASAWASRTVAQVKTTLVLNNVNNTSDAAKPVSTAQQTALDLKANLASPTFTGTVVGITKAMVGLGNVDNTADTAKPVSTATQTALDAKADLVGGLVPTSQIPAIAITEVFTVVSQAAMLALTAQRGDVAVRTDVAKTFILSTDSPSTLADWKEIPAIGAVVSVNGQQGVVVLAKADVGLGSVSNALQLVAASNLSDLANAGTARTNLGVPPSTRAVSAGTGLTGGGDLSADRSFAVTYGTGAGTAAQGNDSRITGAIPASTGTTKGDLLAFTASAAVARLAVGANGDHLRANSAASPGVEWANNRQTQTWAFSGTAVVTTGKARWYNRTGRTLTVVGCWAAANTAPTGAALVCDVNKNGTTIFTTQGNRPSVAISGNGGTMAVPDVTTVADGDYMTVDVDVIGSTIAGADITVGVVYW